MKMVLKKTADWLKENRLAVIYPILAVLIEMTAVFAVEGTPFLSRPLLSLGLMGFIFGVILLLRDNRARLVVGAVMLVLQGVLDLIFAAIFDMTGQYFDLGMLNLRNDAVAALESIPINFFAFYAAVFCCTAYILYGLRGLRESGQYKAKRSKRSPWFYGMVSVLGASVLVGSFYSYYPAKTDRYDEMIRGEAGNAYAAYGMIGNLIGEIGNALKGEESTLTEHEAENFLYAKKSTPTEYFGASKDKNVVMLLSESFEWYAFLKNDEYPNALDFTDEELAALYPNLTQFYNESVVATNFHSREKTDISETMSLLGSYPTESYVNYDYYENVMPNTVPNILKMLDPDIQTRSFHNGFKTFYNRDKAHLTFGFESLTDMYDMEDISNAAELAGGEESFYNYESEGELNLDSEMIETCKDMMFPTDKRFYTYITTITMHGVYYERENLAAVREEVAAVLGERVPLEEENKNANVLYHYMVTAKEFDNALGAMRKDLEDKGLLDDTLIVLFGDHNAYYQQLSNYVKDIDGYDTERNFTDLYNVPLMIRDSSLEPQTIEKFCCTADIVPTLLDLLGIKYYTNLYYGNSIFSDTQSVLYSRAYDIFLREGIVGKSVADIIYNNYQVLADGQKTVETPSEEEDFTFYVTQAEYDEIMGSFYTDAVALVEKIRHCDYIFEKNYFALERNLAQYKGRMLTLNGK